jgi:hypothetical protein
MPIKPFKLRGYFAHLRGAHLRVLWWGMDEENNEQPPKYGFFGKLGDQFQKKTNLPTIIGWCFSV